MERRPISTAEKRVELATAGMEWPACECHGEPQYWQKRADGGHWKCRVRDRDAGRERARQRYAADPDKVREINERWRSANPDKVRERRRRWEAKNRDELNARARRRYAANLEQSREKGRQRQKRLYAANPDAREKGREWAQQWRESNPERSRELWRERNRRRKAQKQDRECERFSEREVFERDGWTCQLCGEPVDRNIRYPDPMSPSLDHVVPLSRGGSHTRANSQLAHLRCNVVKGARAPISAGSQKYLRVL